MPHISSQPALFAATKKRRSTTEPNAIQLSRFLLTARVVRYPNLSNRQPQLDITTGIPVVTIPQKAPSHPLVKYLYLNDGRVLKEDYGIEPTSWTRPGQEEVAPAGSVSQHHLDTAWKRCSKIKPTQ